MGGGLNSGIRSTKIALHAEFKGALGVVLNKSVSNKLIKELKQKIDIPVTITVVSERDDIAGRIAAGVDIFNVSGGENTVQIIERIRDVSNDVAIIATGGKTDETIAEVIDAGANAVSYTPPSTGSLFKEIMQKYRSE
ncbi:MAG: hypothetical protein WA951_09910 [Leeuwenhoekiella sp.]